MGGIVVYNSDTMTQAQKEVLFKAARTTVAAAVQGEAPPELAVKMEGMEYGGMFVTLRQGGRLRGCMGSFSPEPDMLATLQQVAVSASHDPRFSGRPITPADLPGIEIEISVLSEPEETDDPLSLELGRHGLLIENPAGRGCFLPQVATEFGWSKEQFLARCCSEKAGLHAEAWKQPETRVLLFAVELISEC
ncbi:MAG: AmmeMemoRadiSam system protein A [Planctomycetes bacterium]|nr:AmmeMemoRadiSam system protein A [Planctomycetota bacterium]